MKTLIHYCFCLFLYLCVISVSQAQNNNQNNTQNNTIILDDEKKVWNIDKLVGMYEDKTASLSFEQISSPSYQQLFKPNPLDFPNLNITASVVWLRFTIKNQTSEDWLLQIPYQILEYIDIYYQDSTQNFKHKVSGYLLPANHKNFRNNCWLYDLNTKPQQTQTVYVRIQSTTSLQFPLRLVTPKVVISENHDTDVFHGVYYGFMILMLLYNLFIYISVKDKLYLYYVAYIAGTIINNGFLTGYGYEYLWQNYPYVNSMPTILTCLATITALLFTDEFLKLRGNFPKLHTSIVINYVIYVILAILDLVNIPAIERPAIIALQLVVTFSSFAVLLIAYYVYFNGVKVARFYIIAWTFLLIGAICFLLKEMGIAPNNFVTRNGLLLGSMTEVLLLSFALADRINTYRKEKETAEKLFVASLKDNEKLILDQNKTLELKVTERTYQLAETNGELQAINEELALTNEELHTTLETVQSQSQVIAQKNQDITASINYAKRIQTAMLPNIVIIKGSLPQTFILFKPRDIVSGDFYYFADKGEKLILAAVDCTGHGVPGAFMSMIGHDILNQIIHDREISEADEILNQMNNQIRKALKQEETMNRDGMDLALCVINQTKKTVTYAGAMNPFFIVNHNPETPEFIELKADKMPIGGQQEAGKEKKFTQKLINYENPITLYLCSDGFQDQFGGAENRKFMSKRFKELLFKASELPLSAQEQFLDTTFEDWKGTHEQVDDVLVMGVKLV